jgi:hypothetical protein
LEIKNENPDDLLSPQGAGNILGVGATRVRQLEREGRLISVRTASGWRLYRRGDVNALAAARASKRAA